MSGRHTTGERVMSWKFTSRQATATEVARLFIREHFEEPRFILGQQVTGQWTGMRFDGWFHLEGGVKTYKITCDEHGTWAVAAA